MGAGGGSRDGSWGWERGVGAGSTCSHGRACAEDFLLASRHEHHRLLGTKERRDRISAHLAPTHPLINVTHQRYQMREEVCEHVRHGGITLPPAPAPRGVKSSLRQLYGWEPMYKAMSRLRPCPASGRAPSWRKARGT